MGSYLEEKKRLRSRKLRLTIAGDPPRYARDTPLSTKVGTKFRQVAVAQSVKFEPTASAFERAKTVRNSDRVSTVIGLQDT
jgi:hypothetical protein